MSDYKAYIRIRELGTQKVVHSIGVASLSERHVDRAMAGLLINMDTDKYYADDSEVEAARNAS